jgi:hypothetical protein
MADPNERARRQRRQRQAASGYYGGGYGGSPGHPTLTPKGFELMNSSPLKDQSYAMPPPVQGYSIRQVPGVPVDGQRVGGQRVGGQPVGGWAFDEQPSDDEQFYETPPQHRPGRQPADPGPYFRSRTVTGLPQNFLPSQKFPDPNSLIHQPLHRYYQTRQVDQLTDDFPTKAIGRLVIHIDPYSWDQPAFGSAWIVGPNLIATCAHNLFDSNKRRWSRSIEFYPGFDYYSGGSPIQCKVTSCYVPSAYLRNPATNDDIGFCYVDQNIGEIVGQTIPIKPPQTNTFYENTRVTIAGYPAASEFDFGKQLWASRGEYLFGHRMGPGDDYSPVLATNFGGGASGGPWLAQDPDSKQWSAVGLTSGHARLHYHRGELNLMSLTSPMITQSRLDRLESDQVTHSFEV